MAELWKVKFALNVALSLVFGVVWGIPAGLRGSLEFFIFPVSWNDLWGCPDYGFSMPVFLVFRG